MNGFCSFWDSRKDRKLGSEDTDIPQKGKHMSVNGGLVHVWSVQYSALDRYYPVLSALISPEEAQKAAGFKKIGDSRRFIIRHGFVRGVLGYYTHQQPVNLPFVYGSSGKPDLDPKGKFPDIRFSLSHTDERICLGITLESEIGLDIIKIIPRYSFSAISRYLFTPGERQWIAQAVPDKRPVRFFRIWTLKEALLKATGSDARMMKDADFSPVMTAAGLDGFYTVGIGKTDQTCFIHESDCGPGHHRAIVTIPTTPREPAG